jgi:DNA-binding MarR family transcriptional regulator
VGVDVSAADEFETGDAPPAGSSSLEMRLVSALDVVLPRVNRAIRLALNQAEGEARLTVTQFLCLRTIAASPGPAKTTHLARQLQVTAPTMTRTVDTLVERGLVLRQADPADRRTSGLILTEPGRVLMRRYQAEINARLLTLISPLVPAQQERLLAALDDLTAMLDADERLRSRGAENA